MTEIRLNLQSLRSRLYAAGFEGDVLALDMLGPIHIGKIKRATLSSKTSGRLLQDAKFASVVKCHFTVHVSEAGVPVVIQGLEIRPSVADAYSAEYAVDAWE